MKKATLVKTVLQVGLKIAAVGLGIFTLRWFNNTDYVSKVLADEYSKILALNSIVSGFLALGISNVIQKTFTNSDNAQTKSDTLFTFNILRAASLILGIAMVSLAFWLNLRVETIGALLQLNEYKLVVGLFTLQFFLFSDLNFRSVADSTGRSWLYSLTDFASRLLYVGLLYGLVLIVPINYENIINIILISGFVANFGTLVVDNYLYTRDLPKPNFDWKHVRDNMSTIIYIGSVGAFIGLFARFDTIILSGQTGVVRGYSAAYQIFETLQIVPAITMPVLASHIKKSSLSEKRYFLLAVGMGAAYWLVSIVASQILLIITKASENYPASTQVMWILTLGLIPFFLNQLMHYNNVINNREKQETVSIFICGLTAIILYSFLVPVYGIMAAAIISVGCVYLETVLKIGLRLRKSKA